MSFNEKILLFNSGRGSTFHTGCSLLLLRILSCFCFILSIQAHERSNTFHNHPSIALVTTPSSSPSSTTSSGNTNINSNDDSSTNSNNDSTQHFSYSQARNIRVQHGHKAAVPIYQTLLSQNCNENHCDYTAATRIAAAINSPWRHDQTCPLPLPLRLSSNNKSNNQKNHNDNDKKVKLAMEQLRHLLVNSHYDNQNVQKLCGEENHFLAYAKSPIYLKPSSAGSQSRLPPVLDGLLCQVDDDNHDNFKQNGYTCREGGGEVDHALSSLKCLVSLFLLGFALPKDVLVKHLIGGEESVFLLEYLGLLFPCEVDSSIMVPYVHIFPIDVDIIQTNKNNNDDGLAYHNHRGSEESTGKTSIWIITDVHPKILSRTTVGKEEDGAVMYIGPDSLALVQCLPLQSHISSLLDNDKTHTQKFRILDICAGSGIQGILSLTSLKIVKPDATVTFVDVNDRALRFAKFNALLNGIPEEKISTIKTDVTVNSGGDFVKSSDYYDIILANPPFLPTPDSNLILSRYGLFSLGGACGDDVLRSIISLSPSLLRPGTGFLGIVSEFMNPPKGQEGMDAKNILNDIQKWWDDANLQCGKEKGVKGVLFTNECPVTASTYAARRADNEFEFELWLEHLQECSIHSISPGLFFARFSGDNQIFRSCLVPKSELGSIWTPFNVKAVNFVKRIWSDMNQK